MTADRCLLLVLAAGVLTGAALAAAVVVRVLH